MGIVDYFRIPKRAWYWYRNEFKRIPPPEWPVKGTPALGEAVRGQEGDQPGGRARTTCT